MKVTIFGIGSFGFALIKHLSIKLSSDKNVSLFAFARNIKLINNLQTKRSHLYHHKNIKIIKKVRFTHNSKEIFYNTDIIILAVPSNVLLDVLNKNSKFINKPSIILNTAKALDYNSGKCFSELIQQILAIKKNDCPYAVISGGTIASDLFHHEPLGADIACKNQKALKQLKYLFTSENFNIYTTTDVQGVEYAGAFKNVISILAGIIKGLGFSYGSETHFITRASHEIIQLIKKRVTINPYTFSMHSQAWGNDLWLSCTGNTRNRQFGELIGKGYSVKRALALLAKQHKTIEGINTIKSLNNFNLSSKFPILKATQKIIMQNANPKKIIWQLMKSNKM